MNNKENIWNETFKKYSPEELGWYEEVPEISLDLIKRYCLEKKELILDAGCGRGNLILNLLKNEYKNILGIDFSSEAIKKLSADIENNLEKKEYDLLLQVKNLAKPIKFYSKGFLWHDRAVFHFLLEESEKINYIKNLNSFLKVNGFFILACFSKDNIAEKCNGFFVKKYDKEELIELFQDNFELINFDKHDYTMPWGDTRNFIYMVFKKIK
jgi:SAM-dependent methyltransferase